MAVAKVERRIAPRYRFYADVEIEWGSAILKARVCDISATGMFIELSDLLWVSARFTAYLALDKPLQVECEVRRVEPYRGIGVSVVVPGEEGRKRFESLLHALACEQCKLPQSPAGSV